MQYFGIPGHTQSMKTYNEFDGVILGIQIQNSASWDTLLHVQLVRRNSISLDERREVIMWPKIRYKSYTQYCPLNFIEKK